MPISDLVPWKRGEPARQEGERALQREDYPFLTFQQEMNRLFDEFFKGTGFGPLGFRGEGEVFSPRVDAVETDEEIQVSVDLPGVSQEDVNVSLSRGLLTISGEKEKVQEEKGRSYFRAERSYGSFKRSLPLPATVDEDKVDAVFRDGVLKITLPKTAAAPAAKTIPVKKN
jgi:HSP20 family protein